MANAHSHSPAALSYARALIDLAADNAAQVAQELSELLSILDADPLTRAFFSNPTIPQTDRWQVIQRALSSQASQLMLNFLGVLSQKNRIDLLPQINAAYADLLDEKLGRVRVQVTVAQELDQHQLLQVRDKIGSALGKTAIVEQKVDASIVGGLLIKVGDKVIDGSVKSQLQAMRKQLLASRLNIRG